MIEALGAWAARRGYRVAVGSGAAVAAAVRSLRGLEDDGAFAAGFFRENLSWVDGCAPAAPVTLVMAAVPLPAFTVTFHPEGRPLRAIVPVTYLGYRPLFEAVRDDLNREFAAAGTRFAVLQAPLKTVAARLGLVRYGRNNITYCQGLGSYYQLVGLVTETPLPQGAAAADAAPEPLPRCRDCGACRAACPAGAISSSRFLLAADRCLTLASESPGPFPDEARRRRSPCLIGCLECQTCCPENQGKLKLSDAGVSFAEGETRAILASEPSAGASLPPPLREKIAGLRIGGLEAVIGRNLRALLEGAAPARRRMPSG